MNSASPTDLQPSPAFLRSWWPVLAGLLALYIPTYHYLSQTVWSEEEYIHSPMVLVASIWLFGGSGKFCRHPRSRPARLPAASS